MTRVLHPCAAVELDVPLKLTDLTYTAAVCTRQGTAIAGACMGACRRRFYLITVLSNSIKLSPLSLWVWRVHTRVWSPDAVV